MKLKLLYTATAILIANFVTAQILFSENFDNLTVGDLSTDLTGVTPGQGGWYVEGINTEIKVIPETGRGNVAAIGWTQDTLNGGYGSFTQPNIKNLWNNRSSGNDILKLEYEFYLVNTYPKQITSVVRLHDDSLMLTHLGSDSYAVSPPRTETKSSFGFVYYSEASNPNAVIPLGSNGTTVHDNFPYDRWVSVELFIEYGIEGGNIYVYIPSMGILSIRPFYHDIIPDDLSLTGALGKDFQQAAVKYDNIRISAHQTLGINDFISSQFNVFPNPVTDVVTITSSSNIGIEELTVYDMNAKIVQSKKIKNESEIQFNMGEIATGSYLLHIKTGEGVAIKKIIKK